MGCSNRSYHQFKFVSWKCDYKSSTTKMLKFIVLAIALTCVVAKPSGLVYTAPTLYSAPLATAPLATAPLATPLTSTYYNAPLTYSAQSYRPYASYAAPYAYSAYNTYNLRAPTAYSSLPQYIY